MAKCLKCANYRVIAPVQPSIFVWTNTCIYFDLRVAIQLLVHAIHKSLIKSATTLSLYACYFTFRTLYLMLSSILHSQSPFRHGIGRSVFPFHACRAYSNVSGPRWRSQNKWWNYVNIPATVLLAEKLDRGQSAINKSQRSILKGICTIVSVVKHKEIYLYIIILVITCISVPPREVVCKNIFFCVYFFELKHSLFNFWTCALSLSMRFFVQSKWLFNI